MQLGFRYARNAAVVEVPKLELVDAHALAGGFGAESVRVGRHGGCDDAFGGVEGGHEGRNDAGGENQDFA